MNCHTHVARDVHMESTHARASTSRSPGVRERISWLLHHDRNSLSAVPSVNVFKQWVRRKVQRCLPCAHINCAKRHVVCVSVLFCSTCADYLRTPPSPQVSSTDISMRSDGTPNASDEGPVSCAMSAPQRECDWKCRMCRGWCETAQCTASVCASTDEQCDYV